MNKPTPTWRHAFIDKITEVEDMLKNARLAYENGNDPIAKGYMNKAARLLREAKISPEGNWTWHANRRN